MAQQINPTARSLGIEKTWFSILETSDKIYYIQHDLFIRKLISGFFFNYGYLVSELIILHRPRVIKNKYTHSIQIKFILYSIPESQIKNRKSIIYLINQLKNLLHFLYPSFSYFFDLRLTEKYWKNAKILSEWVNWKLNQDPRQYRRLLINILKKK